MDEVTACFDDVENFSPQYIAGTWLLPGLAVKRNDFSMLHNVLKADELREKLTIEI
jgi:hypothetical protein